MSEGPLAGRRVITTRNHPGRLDDLLAAHGADVIHVPLIEVTDATDETVAVARDALAGAEWLVVTSRHGAARVGAAAAEHPELKLAAVGVATAALLAELAGRDVDLVPARQTAADLAAAFAPAPPGAPSTVVVAQADAAEPDLVDALRVLGHRVVAVAVYHTRLLEPSERQRADARGADALTLASGSAARSWVAAFGADAPPVVVAIGPTTARIARGAGLQVTHVAADHDIDGLVREVAAAFASSDLR